MDRKKTTSSVPAGYLPLARGGTSISVFGGSCQIKYIVSKGMANLLSRNKVLLQVEIWGHNMDSFYYLHNNGFRCIRHIGDDFYFVNDK